MLLNPLESPLAEGRELKCVRIGLYPNASRSPLAEGRELKCVRIGLYPNASRSPLAEGRELKYADRHQSPEHGGRPSRRGVN